MSVRISRAYRRGIALASAVALVLAGAGAISSGPAAADPISDCTATTGAIVAVDFSHWGGTVQRGCDAAPSTGLNLLHNAGFSTAGFSTTGTAPDGPGVLCRIGTAAFDTGTEYPASTDCGQPPSSSAAWSYWIAPAGQSSWTSSPAPVASDVPAAGEVQAWIFGASNPAGPSFTPASVRADTPASSTAASSASAAPSSASSGSAVASSPAATTPAKAQAKQLAAATSSAPAGSTPDLTKATAYLVAPANLIAGHYYESFPGFADFGLTIDGALALASAGKNDPALAKIVTFLAQRGTDSGQSVDDWSGIGTIYANGGSIGKEALLAEATGYDPKNFGGHDLIAALDSTVCAAATISVDTACTAAGDYANSASVFAQSLGIMAQLRAGDSANAASPISYLESLQRSSGAWPSQIPDSGDSDVDSTAMAMMALSLAPGASAAVAKGAAWLAAQQQADGGFPGAAGDSTNSAALAVQGMSLDATTHATQIAKALAFLAGQQNSDGGFNVASGGQPGSDVRASAQVVSGATGISYGTLLHDVHGIAAAATGAAYLVGQLVDGSHLANSYGPDYGLTADLAIALASAGGQDQTLAKVAGYLSTHVADYADPAGTSSYPGPYSGSVAKLALIAEITGQPPTAFGGFDLLKTLTTHVCTAPDTAGNCTATGDFYQSFSTVSQSLGVLALARAGVSPPAAAVTRLTGLQCADGGFPSLLIVAGATCTSDVDTTGYALQALLLVPGAEAAAGKAADYLLAAQQSNGGFTGAAGENSNSTGLAMQGLQAAGSAQSAALPARAAAVSAKAFAGTDPSAAILAGKNFLYPLQNSNGGFGINAASPESDVRSTTQVVPALAGSTLAALSRPVTLIIGGSGAGGGPSSGGGSAGSSSAGSSSVGSSTAGSGTTQAAGSLAVTGSQTMTLLSLAILLMLIGGGAIVVGRRRPAMGRRH